DPAVRLLVDARGEEALERLAAFVEHADRGIAGAGDLARDLEQAQEHGVRVQLGDQRAAGGEQRAQASLIHLSSFPRRVVGRPRMCPGGARASLEAMTRVLVAYATRHGSTKEVAQEIAATLDAEGMAVDVLPAANVGHLHGYDGVVLGGALYTGRLH